MKKLILLFSSLLCLAAFAQDRGECIRPAWLKRGDKVAIISPSFATSDSAAVLRGCDVLRGMGLEPVLGQHVWVEPKKSAKGRLLEVYAGTQEQRLDDLLWAYSDPEIKAIICARGGYGGIQLLEKLPLSLYSMNPKWLVGYSDITNFLAASTAAGVMSIHGDMCTAVGDKKGVSDYSQAMLDLLMGKVPQYDIPASPYNVQGHAEGMLAGGNAITYEVLIGTKYDFTQYDNIILFLEDVGESMHAIDRFLYTLKIQGRLPNIKGIIVGNMTKCGEEMDYESVFQLISEFTSKLGIPVSFGLESGHGGHNWPLIMGAQVTLDVTPDGSRLHFNVE